MINKNSSSALNNSIIQSMSHHMNSALYNTQKFKNRENSDSFYIEANDYNSIALNTAPIETNIKMRSPFVSKTERYPEIKQSPGPGSYNITQEVSSVNQSEILMSPQAFGSTYKPRTHFLNAEKTPFGLPTFMESPGVGHYYKSKSIPKRIKNEILKAQREHENMAIQEGYLGNKPAFLGSSGRPCLTEMEQQDVGPGKYDIFISTSPRFKDMTGAPGLHTTKAKHIDEKIEGLITHKPSPASRKMSRLRQLKKESFQHNLKNERSKQSFNFQSKSKRFNTPKPLRIEELKEKEYKDLANHAALLGSHQKHLYMNDKDRLQQAQMMTSYATTIGKSVPFNSQAPRFTNLAKFTSSTPGPGSYGEGKMRTEQDLQRALCEAEGILIRSPKTNMTAAFKSASRLKHSMIDTVIKEKAFLNGPGAYNTNRSTIKKKTFNYDLAS